MIPSHKSPFTFQMRKNWLQVQLQEHVPTSICNPYRVPWWRQEFNCYISWKEKICSSSWIQRSGSNMTLLLLLCLFRYNNNPKRSLSASIIDPHSLIWKSISCDYMESKTLLDMHNVAHRKDKVVAHLQNISQKLNPPPHHL